MGAGFAVNSRRWIPLARREAGLRANDVSLGSFEVTVIEETRRISKSVVSA